MCGVADMLWPSAEKLGPCPQCRQVELEAHYPDVAIFMCCLMAGFCCLGLCLCRSMRELHCASCQWNESKSVRETDDAPAAADAASTADDAGEADGGE